MTCGDPWKLLHALAAMVVVPSLCVWLWVKVLSPGSSANGRGKSKSMALALACAGFNTLLAGLGESILPFLSLASFLGATLAFAIQLGDRPRHFRWIPWVCVVTSLLAISVVDLVYFSVHSAGV